MLCRAASSSFHRRRLELRHGPAKVLKKESAKAVSPSNLIARKGVKPANISIRLFHTAYLEQ